LQIWCRREREDEKGGGRIKIDKRMRKEGWGMMED
jgi:hypothetical protein